MTIEFKEGSCCTDSEFAEWFSSFLLPTGKRCDANDAQTVVELAGNGIGMVHSPMESIRARDIGWVFVLVHQWGKVVEAYAALRLDRGREIMVIDTFAVCEDLRGRGRGRLFFEGILKKLFVCQSAKYSRVCVQSVYDHAKYLESFARHCRYCKKKKKKKTTLSFDVDERAIIAEMTGPCIFWRKMGFDRSKLIYEEEEEGRAISPVLIMQRKEQREEISQSKY